MPQGPLHLLTDLVDPGCIREKLRNAVSSAAKSDFDEIDFSVLPGNKFHVHLRISNGELMDDLLHNPGNPDFHLISCAAWAYFTTWDKILPFFANAVHDAIENNVSIPYNHVAADEVPVAVGLEGQLRFLINEAEVLCDIVESLPAEEEPEEDLICDTSETNPSKPRQKRKTLEEALEGKPFTKRYVDLPEDKKVCPECGTPYKGIGEEYLRTEYVEKQNPEKGTRFDKAVTYIRNRRDLLENYLLDGRCSFVSGK